MKDYILERKITRVIALIAEREGKPLLQALSDFYESRVGEMLHNPETELHLMSDAYIADEYLRHKTLSSR